MHADPMFTTEVGDSVSTWKPRQVAPSSYVTMVFTDSIMRYIHEQLDCFGPEQRLLGRYHLLGGNQRRTGGEEVFSLLRPGKHF